MAVLSPERWQQVEKLFQAALPLPTHARSALLDRECAGDEALRREVESLLAADDRAADDFLQSGVATPGMQALADEETGRTEMALLTVGTTLDGRYKILAELDAGGMGEVYKAQDLKFPNRLVVVKVLKKTSQNIPWIAKKFLRDEGEAQARVQHPNVANVLDKGRLPSGEHYLVVEFIPGATLRQVLEAHENRQMDFPEAAQIIRQVGRAVPAIHNARLIHRDLKPENLMVQDAADTDELLVKVIDFGIVRVLDKSTVVGQIAGTLHYLAPEQLTGQDAGAGQRCLLARRDRPRNAHRSSPVQPGKSGAPAQVVAGRSEGETDCTAPRFVGSGGRDNAQSLSYALFLPLRGIGLFVTT